VTSISSHQQANATPNRFLFAAVKPDWWDELRSVHTKLATSLPPPVPADVQPEPAVAVPEPALAIAPVIERAKTVLQRRVVGRDRQLLRRLVDEAMRARFAGEDMLCRCGCGALTREGRRFRAGTAHTAEGQRRSPRTA